MILSDVQIIHYLCTENLRNLGLTKASDPLKPQSIILEENKTVRNIQKRNLAQDKKTVTELNKVIDDIDYDNQKSIDRAINKTDKIITKHGKIVAPPTSGILVKDSTVYYKKVKKRLAKDFKRPYSFVHADKQAVRIINKWNTTFIGDNYQDNVTKQVDNIIRKTIKESEGAMSRAQVSTALKKQMPGPVRNKGYWTTVASSVLNNARSASSLRFYDDAEVETYEVLAVLDQRTSHVCRDMHGRTFDVKVGLKVFEDLDAAESPDEAKDAKPWMTENTKGQVFLRGNLTTGLSDAELQGQGISTPPYHGRCRTTIVPKF